MSSELVTYPVQIILCATMRVVAFGALCARWQQCPGAVCVCSVSGTGGSCSWSPAVKLLSLGPLAAWSGDGSVLQG